MDFKAIIRERGFTLSFADFGRIVCLTPKRLREIHRDDEQRFFKLLDIAIFRWTSICKKGE